MLSFLSVILSPSEFTFSFTLSSARLNPVVMVRFFVPFREVGQVSLCYLVYGCFCQFEVRGACISGLGLWLWLRFFPSAMTASSYLGGAVFLYQSPIFLHAPLVYELYSLQPRCLLYGYSSCKIGIKLWFLFVTMRFQYNVIFRFGPWIRIISVHRSV